MKRQKQPSDDDAAREELRIRNPFEFRALSSAGAEFARDDSSAPSLGRTMFPIMTGNWKDDVAHGFYSFS